MLIVLLPLSQAHWFGVLAVEEAGLLPLVEPPHPVSEIRIGRTNIETIVP